MNKFASSIVKQFFIVLFIYFIISIIVHSFLLFLLYDSNFFPLNPYIQYVIILTLLTLFLSKMIISSNIYNYTFSNISNADNKKIKLISNKENIKSTRNYIDELEVNLNILKNMENTIENNFFYLNYSLFVEKMKYLEIINIFFNCLVILYSVFLQFFNYGNYGIISFFISLSESMILIVFGILMNLD